VLAGRYRIRDSLGAGTVGVVYRAQDTGLNTDVALKIIAPDMIPDVNTRRAFIQAMRHAQGVDHPNLARVLDVRQDGDLALVATQLLEGLTLRRLLTTRKERHQRMPAEEVRPILEQVAEALTTAHPDVCHGCLKPEDIILLPDHVKLLDLGLAAALPRETFLTAFRQADGPLAYLAPELRARMPVTPRADVYSLGVVVYEMLTGVAPLEAPRSVRTFDGNLPQAYDEIVRRALAVDPAHRYRAPEGLVADFVAVLEGRQLGPPPYGSPMAAKSTSGSVMGTPVPVAEGGGSPHGEADEVREPTDPGVIWPFAEMTPMPAPAPQPPGVEERESAVLAEPSLTDQLVPAEPAKEPAPPEPVPEPAPTPVAGPTPTPTPERETAEPEIIDSDMLVEATPTPVAAVPKPSEPPEEAEASGLVLAPPGVAAEAPANPPSEPAPGTSAEVDAGPEPASAAAAAPPVSPTVSPSPPPEPEEPAASAEAPVEADAPAAAVASEAAEATAAPVVVPAGAPPGPAGTTPMAVAAPRPRRRPTLVLWVVGSLALGLVSAGVVYRVRQAQRAEQEDEWQRLAYEKAVAQRGPDASSAGTAAPPTARPSSAATPPTTSQPTAPPVPAAAPDAGPAPRPDARTRSSSRPRRGKCPDGMKRISPRRTDTYCIDKYEYPGVAKMPRTDVTWDQADADCHARGARLCTSTEWTRACRGPGGADYPYGEPWDPLACNTAAADGAKRDILPSGAQRECRSAHGVYDMSGNAAEWLDDKTIRGGSAASDAEGSRCGARSSGGASAMTGFRCCADPEREEEPED